MTKGASTAADGVTAIILAGGRSRRIGRDKCTLPVNGRPLIEHVYKQLVPHVTEVLVSTNDPSQCDFLGVRAVADEVSGQGPLMGIASALAVSTHEVNLVVACDIPEIDAGFVQGMLGCVDGWDGVVPVDAEGRYEPLLAVYRRTMLEPMRRVLTAGGRRIRDVYGLCRIRTIELGSAPWFYNINTREDYAAYTRRLRASSLGDEEGQDERNG